MCAWVLFFFFSVNNFMGFPPIIVIIQRDLAPGVAKSV